MTIYRTYAYDRPYALEQQALAGARRLRRLAPGSALTEDTMRMAQMALALGDTREGRVSARIAIANAASPQALALMDDGRKARVRARVAASWQATREELPLDVAPYQGPPVLQSTDGWASLEDDFQDCLGFLLEEA